MHFVTCVRVLPFKYQGVAIYILVYRRRIDCAGGIPELPLLWHFTFYLLLFFFSNVNFICSQLMQLITCYGLTKPLPQYCYRRIYSNIAEHCNVCWNNFYSLVFHVHILLCLYSCLKIFRYLAHQVTHFTSYTIMGLMFKFITSPAFTFIFALRNICWTVDLFQILCCDDVWKLLFLLL
jgi:hypothetical protein